MFCKGCGREVTNQKTFCSYCGAAISNTPKSFASVQNISYMDSTQCR